MRKESRNSRFGRKYGLFLSDASNEEIVAVSKELTDGLSEQVRLVVGTATAMLAVTVLSLIFSISLISGLGDSMAGSAKSAVFLLRITAVALMCISGFEAYAAIRKAASAAFAAPFVWRHVRETASDDSAYEQVSAVRAMSQSVVSAKNLLDMSAFVLALSGLLIGVSYMFQIMAESGYV